jgi:hypothetical protein
MDAAQDRKEPRLGSGSGSAEGVGHGLVCVAVDEEILARGIAVADDTALNRSMGLEDGGCLLYRSRLG